MQGLEGVVPAEVGGVEKMPKEKRLIKPETIKLELSFIGCEPKHLAAVERCATVVAVEVVHGHWTTLYKVDTWMGTSTIDCYICSECGKSSKAKGNYCPNCGAKMDGGNGDD